MRNTDVLPLHEISRLHDEYHVTCVSELTSIVQATNAADTLMNRLPAIQFLEVKVIARELGIEAGTVKSHLKRIMSKLNVTARTQAVVVATQRGLIDAETSAGVASGTYMSLRNIRSARNVARLHSSHRAVTTPGELR